MIWIYRVFLVWYGCGFILLTFDLIPKQLEWSNAVFLILAGIIGFIYFTHTYKWKGFFYSSVVFLVSMIVEHVGTTYEIWFGDYYYTEDFGLTIGGVPITIGFAWVMVMGGAHVVSKQLTKRMPTHFRYIVFLLLGGFMAVGIDLILDPVAYQIKEYWIWEESGIYYDIPLSNFTGWFFLAVVFQLFALPLLTHTATSQWDNRIIVVFMGTAIMFIWLALFGGLYLAALLTIVVLGMPLLLYVRMKQIHDTSQ
ncbi:carotenoid biosynthesis protein [Pontibacillus halophilus]|uniref:carotenoid biosynthesis protein n=1 Tax=Pontibacillus halophilus TaxID=516704 RepID=UPI00040997A7|nr:carotenoid biosynthesis protein [Pontibacillus halophilus]